MSKPMAVHVRSIILSVFLCRPLKNNNAEMVNFAFSGEREHKG